jgi:acetyltransferase-like isoleucine patch superfamily enzyme
MRYVSRKARVKGFLEGDCVILGPSIIGSKSVLGLNVMVGYPARKKIKAFRFSRNFNVGEFDRVSAGAQIGDSCIIRSGTIIYENAKLGNHVETGHNVLVRQGSTIGDKTRIGSSSQLDGSVSIGKNVSIQSNVYLPHLSTIEDDVFLGPSVVVTNDPYPPSKRRQGVVVEEGAAIGAIACIVVPARIGKNSIVAAGAVVTADVPPGTVVLGVPAKPYITREEYDKKKSRWEKEEE